MLIISLRKISNTQKNNLKQFYKLIVFDPRLHLRKTISQLVKGCDIVLIELDLSRVFSIGRNIIYKYLKQQNIVDIATTFVYESSKYRGLFKDHINFFIRKLPLLFDRELETVIDDQAYLDQDTKSVYKPDPLLVSEESEKEGEEEVSTTASTDTDSKESEIIKRIVDIEKQIDVLIERLKTVEGVAQPNAEPRPISGESEPVVEPVVKRLKVKQGSKKLILLSDDKVVKEYPYRNAIEKRRAKKEAGKHLLQLSKSE